MRLAVLSSHPVQYYGPLFRELAKSIDLHVFFAHKATPEQQSAAGFGAAFEWDLDLTSGYSHSFLNNISTNPGTSHFSGCDTPEIAARLADGKFDALLTIGWHLKSLIQGLIAAKRLGIPVMVRGDSQLATQRSWLKRTAKSVVYPGFLRLFDAALYVGARSRDYYLHYHYPRSRLFFSPHCVDNAFFAARATSEARSDLRRELGIPQDRFVALFAGKLLPFKRPLDVIEAVGINRRRGLLGDVLIAGSGDLEGDLRQSAQAGDVPLHMLGFCNQTRMPVAYAAADVLVLPSTERETWGLVSNEALACGRPIVVSDACGCAPDLTGGDDAGRSFRVGAVAELADALAEIQTAPPSRESISRLSERYSLRSAADGIVEAFETCSSRSGRSLRSI